MKVSPSFTGLFFVEGKHSRPTSEKLDRQLLTAWQQVVEDGDPKNITYNDQCRRLEYKLGDQLVTSSKDGDETEIMITDKHKNQQFLGLYWSDKQVTSLNLKPLIETLQNSMRALYHISTSGKEPINNINSMLPQKDYGNM